MSTTAQKVCIEALSLPQRSRAEIAERLLSSLDEDTDAGSDRLWKLEIRRCQREIRERKTKLIPADEEKVLRALDKGLKSPEHGAFVRKTGKR
jgi:hypothetical protein